MKPVLKWAGGKAKLAVQISEAFGARCSGTYIEPFMGSGAVFLHRRSLGQVGNAILADVNPKLMAVHIALRDRVDDVLSELDELPRLDWEASYYQIREYFNEGPWQGPRHAARFIWLNRAGYNGLYRENSGGKYNVPCGRYAKLHMPAPAAFRAVGKLLEGVELVATGFEEAMARAGRGDQVYCDPPYVPLSATANFTAYCKGPFGHREQQNLADAAFTAARRGALVVLSNHDLPVVREELYTYKRGFRYVGNPQVSRAISRKATHRGRVGEVIAAIGGRPVMLIA